MELHVFMFTYKCNTNRGRSSLISPLFFFPNRKVLSDSNKILSWDESQYRRDANMDGTHCNALDGLPQEYP